MYPCPNNVSKRSVSTVITDSSLSLLLTIDIVINMCWIWQLWFRTTLKIHVIWQLSFLTILKVRVVCSCCFAPRTGDMFIVVVTRNAVNRRCGQSRESGTGSGWFLFLGPEVMINSNQSWSYSTWHTQYHDNHTTLSQNNWYFLKSDYT